MYTCCTLFLCQPIIFLWAVQQFVLKPLIKKCMQVHVHMCALNDILLGHSYSQTEMVYKKNPKFLNQIQYCEREQIPIMVVIGEGERDKNGVKIRDVETQKEVHLWTI